MLRDRKDLLLQGHPADESLDNQSIFYLKNKVLNIKIYQIFIECISDCNRIDKQTDLDPDIIEQISRPTRHIYNPGIDKYIRLDPDIYVKTVFILCKNCIYLRCWSCKNSCRSFSSLCLKRYRKICPRFLLIMNFKNNMTTFCELLPISEQISEKSF